MAQQWLWAHWHAAPKQQAVVGAGSSHDGMTSPAREVVLLINRGIYPTHQVTLLDDGVPDLMRGVILLNDEVPDLMRNVILSKGGVTTPIEASLYEGAAILLVQVYSASRVE